MATYEGEMQHLIIGDKEYSLPVGGSSTDEKVKLTSKSDSVAYKVPLAPASITSGNTYEEYYSGDFTYNPSTHSLSTTKMTFSPATTGFTISGGNTTSKTLTVNESYTLGAASAKGVTDNSSNADVTSSDTNLITGRTLYYQLAKKGYTTNTGTVTSVAVINDTNGGLSVSGSPISTSGTITIGHSNVLTSAQTTQAVYPIKIDKNGHISAYGSAVTIPTATNSATTGITATTTATKTTLGTAGSVYGVKSGTNSTTTASKASGSNGSASTWTFEEKTIPNVTAAGSGSFTSTVTNHVLSFSHTHTAPTIGTEIKVQSKSGGGNGTAPTWSFTDVTVPIRADSATSVPNVSVASATVSISDPGHTHSI